MKVLILLCAITLLAVSINIENRSQSKQIALGSSNLGFNNGTGAGCSAAEYSSFVNYINLGSSFHRSDYIKLLLYITDELTKNYGNSNSKFSTILQSFDSYNTWYIYSSYSQYATAGSKSDRNFPTSSYMFIRVDDSNNDYLPVYLSTLTTGVGINSTKQTVIKNIILSEETQTSCYCYPRQISEKLKQYDGQSWSVICSESYNHYFWIYAKDFQYIYTKPRNCYYGMWVV